MATMRVMPPADGRQTTITVNGRTYTCPLGSTIDVPDVDSRVMTANGWTSVASGGVGVSTARPTNPTKGQMFHDTTLGKNITWDGKVWRDPATGAAV